MNRKDVIENLKNRLNDLHNGYQTYLEHGGKQDIETENDIEALNMAIEALQEPEIVHCKDCKYWLRTRIGEEELNQCGLAGYLIGGRGYCLYGKAGEKE